MKKKFGIIGNPIKHSLSPILHEYWFKKYKINAEYSIIEAKDKDLPEIVKKIKSNSDVIMFTDSIYVKNGITEWMVKWKKNGWKNANKKPVKNKDLWIKLDSLCEKNNVSWKWVKGHSSNKYNNLADELATGAIKN